MNTEGLDTTTHCQSLGYKQCIVRKCRLVTSIQMTSTFTSLAQYSNLTAQLHAHGHIYEWIFPSI